MRGSVCWVTANRGEQILPVRSLSQITSLLLLIFYRLAANEFAATLNRQPEQIHTRTCVATSWPELDSGINREKERGNV